MRRSHLVAASIFVCVGFTLVSIADARRAWACVGAGYGWWWHDHVDDDLLWYLNK